MATSVSNRHGARRSDEAPPEAERVLSGMALALAGANVVMQLSMLPVGHGVAKSEVESGRVDLHPIKRARTTLSYIAIASLGTEDERAAMRREVNRSHANVRSGPDDPVAYNAFDPELQLWVAACLYRGIEDLHRVLYGEPEPEVADILYRHAARLGTTLQVSEEQWPADRAAFDRYWNAKVAEIEMDDLTRAYLRKIAGGQVFGAPLDWLMGPPNRLLTVGFLPQPFRDELGLPWDRRRQAIFDAVVGVGAAVSRNLPRPLRQFPMNAYLWDTRRRIRTGKPIV